jgi:hypothetical protein
MTDKYVATEMRTVQLTNMVITESTLIRALPSRVREVILAVTGLSKRDDCSVIWKQPIDPTNRGTVVSLAGPVEYLAPVVTLIERLNADYGGGDVAAVPSVQGR